MGRHRQPGAQVAGRVASRVTGRGRAVTAVGLVCVLTIGYLLVRLVTADTTGHLSAAGGMRACLANPSACPGTTATPTPTPSPVTLPTTTPVAEPTTIAVPHTSRSTTHAPRSPAAGGGSSRDGSGRQATAKPRPPHHPRSTSPAPATVAYVVHQWPDGFGIEVRFANATRRPWTSWTLAFSMPRGTRVTRLWNGRFVHATNPFAVTNDRWNGFVQPGQQTGFGFLGTGAVSLRDCRLNGLTCRFVPATSLK